MTDTNEAAALAVRVSHDFPAIFALCDRIFQAGKADNNIQVLQAYEELLTIDATEMARASDDAAALEQLTAAWGRAMIAAQRLHNDDDHLAEMQRDHQDRVGFPSPYLRAIRIQGVGTPVQCLKKYIEVNGLATNDVVEGALARFPECPLADVRDLVHYCRDDEAHRLALSESVLGKIQKRYLAAMRTGPTPATVTSAAAEPPQSETAPAAAAANPSTAPDTAETVFQQMLEDGIRPNIFTYTALFMCPTLRLKTTMQYYDDMLSRGIAPIASTYKIISRHGVGLSREQAAMFRRRAAGNMSLDEWQKNVLHKCAEDGEADKARNFYRQLKLEGVILDRCAYNHLVASCKNDAARAEEWLSVMSQDGQEPNAVTFTNLMHVHKESAQAAADHCERFFNLMTQTYKIPCEIHTCQVMLDALARSHQRQKLQQYFKAFLESAADVVSPLLFNIAMKIGPFDWCVGCFAAFLAHGYVPSMMPMNRTIMQGFVRDDVSRTIFDLFETCHWQRDAILTNAELTAASTATWKRPFPSLHECLRFMLREMKTEEATMRRLADKLTAEMEGARQRTGRGGSTPPSTGLAATSVTPSAVDPAVLSSAIMSVSTRGGEPLLGDRKPTPEAEGTGRGGGGAHHAATTDGRADTTMSATAAPPQGSNSAVGPPRLKDNRFTMEENYFNQHGGVPLPGGDLLGGALEDPPFANHGNGGGGRGGSRGGGGGRHSRGGRGDHHDQHGGYHHHGGGGGARANGGSRGGGGGGRGASYFSDPAIVDRREAAPSTAAPSRGGPHGGPRHDHHGHHPPHPGAVHKPPPAHAAPFQHELPLPRGARQAVEPHAAPPGVTAADGAGVRGRGGRGGGPTERGVHRGGAAANRGSAGGRGGATW